MDLKLIKREHEEMEQFNFTLYRSTKKELTEICEAEGIKPTILVRHLINTFIEQYRKGKK